MSSGLEKRLKREIKAREEAERLLDQKSLELYARNQELEVLLKQQKNERLHLFENAVVGVALTYNEVILDINHTFATLLGYQEKEELIGLSILDITHPDDAADAVQKTKELHEHKVDHFRLKKRYMRKDGTYFWGLTNVNEIKDLEGNTKYHLALVLNLNNEVKSQKKLELTVNHLREINQNLEQFAYIVSHDLKAPLNGINTVVNWLKEKDLDQESQKYLDLIQERTSKMNEMIKEILNYSQNKSEEEHREPIDTEQLVIEAVKMFTIPAHVRMEFKGDFPTVYVNPTKLQQVFNNLIDNALRFLDKPKGLIRIEAKEWEDHYQFIVFDNGQGIDERNFESIFELYSQNDSKRTKNQGIGLTLVKRIVEQYGGKIKVQSEKGLFTEFTFTLDKERVSYPPNSTSIKEEE